MPLQKNVTLTIPGTGRSKTTTVRDGEKPHDVVAKFVDDPAGYTLRRSNTKRIPPDQDVAPVVEEDEALFATPTQPFGHQGGAQHQSTAPAWREYIPRGVTSWLADSGWHPQPTLGAEDELVVSKELREAGITVLVLLWGTPGGRRKVLVHDPPEELVAAAEDGDCFLDPIVIDTDGLGLEDDIHRIHFNTPPETFGGAIALLREAIRENA